MEILEGHFQGGGRQKYPKKGKEKWTHLDVTRHVEGRGKQAKHEKGRKMCRIKKTKWRKKLGKTRKTIYRKNAGCWNSAIKKEEQENYINR
jgi:hypothetical protein